MKKIKNRFRIYLCGLFCVFYQLAFSQNNIHINYQILGNENSSFLSPLSLPLKVNDSLLLPKLNIEILNFCAQKSYILANVYFQFLTPDSVNFIINLKQKFKLIILNTIYNNDIFLAASGFKNNQFSSQVFNPILFEQKISKTIEWFQNNAYPFASIKFDSVVIDSNIISANIIFNKGPQIVFDSIKVIGNAKISTNFLANYTNIKIGKYYNESILKRTDNRIVELPYLSLNQPSVVYFYGNKARLILNVNNKNASSFDGIIGFAPSNSLNQKLLITGDLNLKLQNILGSGKSFDLNYRSFLNNSQELKIKFNYPYLYNTKISLDYGLNFLLFDTTFFDLQNDFGIQYRYIGTDYFKVFYSTQSTSLITVDTSLIRLNKVIPNFNDVKKDFYGIGFKKTKIDYFPNPSKGFLVEIDLAIGTKNIIKNNSINALKLINDNGNFYSIYDSIKLSYTQFKASLKFEDYIKITSKIILKTELNGAWFQTENLYLNELFRIGGLKTLRGFNEQSIFANKFAIANTEIRYLLNKNSNVFLFYNQAWYKNEVSKLNLSDNPFGFGTGLLFESGLGLFTLVYAIGKQFNNPIEWNAAKIHFGYINYF